MGTAVQFGAGNIGRGFLAQLFHESGLEVVFVDVMTPVVEALNNRRAYTIHIVGPEASLIPIDNVRAVHGRDRSAVVSEIVRCDIACTAVGANALPHAAPALAAGLLERYRQSGTPLNVLLCENLHDAPAVMRRLLSEHLPEDERDAVLARTGLVQAVVSRMVPVQTESDRQNDLLAIRVEAYKRLPIDARAVVGTLPAMEGVEQTERFEAYVARKLYVHNCAHAVLGYLGHLAGFHYGYQALRDPRIASLLRAVLAETGDALVRKYGFSQEEQQKHVSDLLMRFTNEALGDTCQRLARDPLRKLAPDDRLVGAARLCESQHIEPRAVAWAIAAALRHEDSSDPSAVELQRLLRTSGREQVLRTVCGILPGEPLSRLIHEALETTEAFSGSSVPG